MAEAIKKSFIKNGLIYDIDKYNESKNGKVIYEVLRISKGKPLFFEEHYQRFINSIKLTGLDFYIDESWLRTCILKLVDHEKLTSENIKITYDSETTDLKIFVIKHKYPTLKVYSEGVDTILYFGERTNPNAKVVNSEFRSAVNEEIKRRGVYEAILVSNNGIVTEGSKSNIFMIKGDVLYTSELKDVLKGVTRTEIIKVAEENNIKVVEGDIKYLELNSFDALFISGTSPNILPIKSVEGHEFDTKNQLLRELMRLFKAKIKTYLEAK